MTTVLISDQIPEKPGRTSSKVSLTRTLTKNSVRNRNFFLNCIFEGLDFKAGFIPLLTSTYNVSKINLIGNFGKKIDFKGNIESHYLKFEHDDDIYRNLYRHESFHHMNTSRKYKSPNHYYTSGKNSSTDRLTSHEKSNLSHYLKNNKIQTKKALIDLPVISIDICDEAVKYDNGISATTQNNNTSNLPNSFEHYLYVDVHIEKFIKVLDNHIINQMIFGFEAIMSEVQNLKKKLDFEPIEKSNTLEPITGRQQNFSRNLLEETGPVTGVGAGAGTNPGQQVTSTVPETTPTEIDSKLFHINIKFDCIELTASTSTSNAVQFAIPHGIGLQITNVETIKNKMTKPSINNFSLGSNFNLSSHNFEYTTTNNNTPNHSHRRNSAFVNNNNDNNNGNNNQNSKQNVNVNNNKILLGLDGSSGTFSKEIYAQSSFSLKLSVGLMDTRDNVLSKKLGEFDTNFELSAQIEADSMKDSRFELDIEKPTLSVMPSAVDLGIRFYLSYRSSYEAWTNQRNLSHEIIQKYNSRENITSHHHHSHSHHHLQKSNSNNEKLRRMPTSSVSNNLDKPIHQVVNSSSNSFKKLELLININEFEVHLPLVKSNNFSSKKGKSNNSTGGGLREMITKN